MKVKRNNLKSVTAMTGIGLKGTKVNPLDSFFPFDPCLLRLVHQVIEKLYRPWKGLPGIDYDTDGEYPEDEDVENNSDYHSSLSDSNSEDDDEDEDDNDNDQSEYMTVIDQTENEENDNYIKLISSDNGHERHESFDSSNTNYNICYSLSICKVNLLFFIFRYHCQ